MGSATGPFAQGGIRGMRSRLGKRYHRMVRACVLLQPKYLRYAMRYRMRKPRLRPPVQDRQTALREAILWLCRSQEAGPDQGSSCFRMATGWSRGYPEVTGYNLHTLLEYYTLTGDTSAYEHAICMADWELTVQLDCGAYRSGYVGSPHGPVTFNTGQVLQGLVKAFLVTGQGTYMDAARRAANWLLEVQDPDGAWRKCVYLGEFRVTDTRVAYPLLEMWQASGDDRYREAAVRNLRYVATLQSGNGWLPLCDISLDLIDQPLTHTLAYTCEGFHKSGAILKDDLFIQAARLTADGMLRRFEIDGVLYGRYNSDWQGTVPWTCLTGCAQTSEIWSLLAMRFKEARYLRAALRMNDYLCACQDVSERDPAMRGAISGSEPLGGDYQPYTFPSWVTKYFCDALMAEARALRSLRPEM